MINGFMGKLLPRPKSLTVSFRLLYRGIKTCILGANGGIGQVLSMLVKVSPWFEEVMLFDKQSCKGLALELNLIDSPCLVSSYDGQEGLRTALDSCQMVINLASSSKVSPATDSEDTIFQENAKIAYRIAKECARHCPQAIHLVVSNPVNSLVPLICETYQKEIGWCDSKKVLGLTLGDVIRTSAKLAEASNTKPEDTYVPVIGGHSETTMVPLLSQARPCVNLSQEEVVKITKCVTRTCNNVVKAKTGVEGSAILSVAYATFRMAEVLAKAMFGQQGLVECAYVKSSLLPEVSYFASPVVLGASGVQRVLPLPEMSSYEQCLLESSISYLKKEVQKGKHFVLEK